MSKDYKLYFDRFNKVPSKSVPLLHIEIYTQTKSICHSEDRLEIIETNAPDTRTSRTTLGNFSGEIADRYYVTISRDRSLPLFARDESD